MLQANLAQVANGAMHLKEPMQKALYLCNFFDLKLVIMQEIAHSQDQWSIDSLLIRLNSAHIRSII